MMLVRLLVIVICLSGFTASEEATSSYIDNYKDLAIIEMYRTGVPASITLAQAIHESVSGTSTLANNSNNHFGIKCKSYWKGQSYYHKDDDRNKRGKLIDSCFRAYEAVADSYIDHSNFLRYSSNYQSLFTLSRRDYVGWSYGLKESGYATDKRYAQKLIKIIEKHNLSTYDLAKDPRTWIK